MNNITLTSVSSKDPFFFQLNGSSITSDKMMSTEDWNFIIEMVGIENSHVINELVTKLAYTEDKVIYVYDIRFGIVIPAIITYMEDKHDIVTLNLILNKQKLYVVNHNDIQHMVVFNTKEEAMLCRAAVAN